MHPRHLVWDTAQGGTMHRMLRRSLSAALVLSLITTSAVTATSGASEAPTWERAACPFQLPPGQIEGETVDCGYLSVPEKRADPDSRIIRLAVAVFHHRGSGGHETPLIYLEGGPGGSPLKLLALRDFEGSYGPFLDAGRTVVFLDQRGVGRSQPALDCPAFVDLYLDLLGQPNDRIGSTAEGKRARKVKSLVDCARELEAVADLGAYNTAESAADIEDLRLALGYDQLDLWGTSYGSRLALAVMRDHPDAVRAAVLDAPLPPEADLYTTPDAYDRALTEVFQECARDPACDAAYPDLEDVFDETLERLDGDPAIVSVHDPLAGLQRDLVLDGPAFAEQVFRGLYSTGLRQALPGIIYDAHAGTFDTLLLTAQLDVLRQYFRSWGMYFSVLCHDEVPFSSRGGFEEARARHPRLAGMWEHFEIGPLTFDVCERWDAGVAPALENEPVVSDVPTLLMTGQYLSLIHI